MVFMYVNLLICDFARRDWNRNWLPIRFINNSKSQKYGYANCGVSVRTISSISQLHYVPTSGINL